DLDVPPAVQGVHLSRVDVRLEVTLDLGERFGGGPLVAAGGGFGRRGVAESADGIVVEVPAGHLAQGEFGLDEGLLDAEQAGHAAGPPRDVAVYAQDAVGAEVALLAKGAGGILAAQGDGSDGGQDGSRVPALGASGVRLGAEAGGPPFCSAVATRPSRAAARVERNRARPS